MDIRKTGWLGWVLIVLVLVGIVYGAAQLGLLDFIAPGLKTTESQTLEKTNIQKVNVGDKVAGDVQVSMPSTTPVQSGNPIKIMVAGWNAQQGIIFANGGISTTEGSIAAKHGLNNTFIWNDDYGQMQQGLLAHAKACARGDFFSGEGHTFAAFMGDGAPGFLEAINPIIESEYGPEYIVEGFNVFGFSYGEDKWLGPPRWKQDPQSARGSRTIVYLRDGDNNIVLKWASDNGIPVNPDPTTYDPTAINFCQANTYIHAAQLFISGVTETLPVVKEGKRTGEQRSVTAEGVATWLPGDQMVVDQKGGVITIADTKDYAGQMPCLIVGVKAFNQRYPDIIDGLILSGDEGAKAIRSSDQARWRAAEISAELYQQNDAQYWYKYFDGEPRTVEIDGRSYVINLGGSRVCTLQDVIGYFGMAPNSRNIFKDTYNFFGNLYVKLWPDLMPKYPLYDQVINTSYLQRVKSKTGTQAPTSMAKFQAGSEVTQIVGKKSWSIEFEFGSAQLTNSSQQTLEQLASELTMNYELKIVIEGHTDNVGTDFDNQRLSEARAAAVRDWLYQHYPVNFPMERMNTLGFGESKPIGDNETPAGRALNRRAMIITGR